MKELESQPELARKVQIVIQNYKEWYEALITSDLDYDKLAPHLRLQNF